MVTPTLLFSSLFSAFSPFPLSSFDPGARVCVSVCSGVVDYASRYASSVYRIVRTQDNDREWSREGIKAVERYLTCPNFFPNIPIVPYLQELSKIPFIISS